MKIAFGGHELVLHQAGCLYWPQQRLLIVSDLHLEKGSHYARRGFFLPPYDTHRTLQSLLEVCEETDCARLLLLGDCFHDPGGFSRLSAENRMLFNELRRWNPIWIFGNHDGDFAPEGFDAMASYLHQGILFNHISSASQAYEISGHYHPKAIIPETRISKPCFIEDGRKLILPAFGSYTGGLCVTDKAFQTLFQTKPRIYLSGAGKIYRIE